MNIEVPDFGELLAGHIGRIPEASQPAFLSSLERTAADRYRHWAEQLPAHAELLLDCAQREDEIAARVVAMLPASSETDQQLIDGEIDAARSTYYDAFSGHTVWEQLYLQSKAERQGAAAWRAYAAAPEYQSLAEDLEACARIEEASADALDRLLAEFANVC
jgi:hypothetical protein